MKRHRLVALIILLIGLLISGETWAQHGGGFHGGGFHGGGFHGGPGHGFHHGGFHHSHGSVGVVIGAPLAWPWYYPAAPYYYPYYPPVAVVPGSPPEYIERQDEQPSAEAPSGYWYYCSDPQGYYPYVGQCNSAWQQVPATPPGS